jgi:DNA polymerase V
MKRFLLIDCNNFFVSCERVFNPALKNKPVIVLSSNDGCVIARSNEAKLLGIPMGIPAFQCADLVKKHNIQVFSSNFALYGDMSNRIMYTLAQYVTALEIYSIDEAFLFIPEVTQSEELNNFYYTEYAQFLRKKVLQHTGIPISIGIGPTKTLAKVANKIAKKNSEHNGVFDITHRDKDTILEQLDVRDIWGIGSRYAKFLHAYGIHTARDFMHSNEQWIKKKLTVFGHKTLLELRGVSCLHVEEITSEKKSITVSRSFGRSVTSYIELQESVAHYISMAAQKLRAQNMAAGVITVFIIF